MSLQTYADELERATLRVRSQAARWPQDRNGAWAVLLLAADWAKTGQLSPVLLANAAEHMPEHDAVMLAQTLGVIAQRGCGMCRAEVAR